MIEEQTADGICKHQDHHKCNDEHTDIAQRIADLLNDTAKTVNCFHLFFLLFSGKRCKLI